MELIERYRKLCQEPNNATRGWYQNRGYEFEEIITEVLKRDGLCPRSSYKTKGEQIDGSFILGDRVYLLEAKWHKKEMSASDIYEFKGKVDGKLVGTIGVFISMSGFSKDAVDALIYGKEVNIILFDRNDFEIGIEESGAFKRLLLEKIRMAAEEGSPFIPSKAIYEIKNKDEKFEKVINSPVNVKRDNVVIICEGETDERLLSILCRRITEKKVTIITANGIRNIPLLANKILADKEYGKVILVADSNGNENKVNAMFREMVGFEGWQSVIINDSIEAWFDIDKKFRDHKSELLYELEKGATENEISKMIEKYPSFKLFYELVVGDK